ncbi:hypothetical protein JS533_011045 [Bifidobacterium amazonense]|uniref:Uncharacterized protein n=1 Tax=Bifidobacterium amazonense TaxID=2809027 RepID=A0ABS9VXI2_9BIFI|nr:hypothetical protein [Bifidobacterium amazonense]MCH9276803.1 hypothetical protein [Bifidobacterium amazonense]
MFISFGNIGIVVGTSLGGYAVGGPGISATPFVCLALSAALYSSSLVMESMPWTANA